MKRLFLLGAAVVALLGPGISQAHGGVDFNISIGVPGGHARPHYHPPVRYVERPQVIVVPGPRYEPVPVYRSGGYYNHYSAGPKHHHKHKHKHPKHHHKRHHHGHSR